MNEVKLDNKDFLEDSLLNKHTIRLIENYHGGRAKLILRHKKVGNYEVDGIIVLELYSCKRLIGVELKEYNFIDVIDQAIERRKDFHYFYIITRFPVHFLGDIVKSLIVSGSDSTYWDKFKRLFENKIGWIFYNDGFPPLMFLPSFYNKGKEIKGYIKNLLNKPVDVII